MSQSPPLSGLEHDGLEPTLVEQGPVDNYLAVQTPENISFQYHLAGPFQRLLAFLLDFFFSQIAYWFLFICLMILGGLLLATLGPVSELVGGIYLFCGLVGAFLVFWFYGAYMETHYNGRTWGKMLTSQRVLNVDGSAIHGSQALLRNFFRLIDTGPVYLWPVELDLGSPIYLPIPTGIFGLVMMCLNRDFRRIGDLVAGTIVVKDELNLTAKLTTFNDPRVAWLAERIPDSLVVDRELASALAAYVERRPFLGQGRTDEIARRLAPLVLEALSFPTDTNPDLLLCSLYFKAFHSGQIQMAGSPGTDPREPRVTIPARDGAPTIATPPGGQS